MKENQTNTKKLGCLWMGLAMLAVIIAGVFVMMYLVKNGPQADKEQAPKLVPVVRVIVARLSSEKLSIETQGRIVPAHRTQAASEVMGRVVMVSPKFKTGGLFERDEIMLKIDSADYIAALATAESALADAKLLLAQEEARAAQARRDWEKLGRGEPSDLVLRKPQIVSAKARIAAAEAAVEKARRDLDRTKLRAPYDCRVQHTYTDLGSYVMIGARLADVYSTRDFELRVPVTLEEMAYLPEKVVGTPVTAGARVGNQQRTWKGVVVRSEGIVDNQTMTVYFVVQIKPNKNDDRYPLPPSGLFVKATLQGRVMEKVTSIPRSALRFDNTVLTLTPENKLSIVPVKVARTLRTTVLISEGLKDGTRVITSPLETPVEGMELKPEE